MQLDHDKFLEYASVAYGLYMESINVISKGNAIRSDFSVRADRDWFSISFDVGRTSCVVQEDVIKCVRQDNDYNYSVEFKLSDPDIPEKIGKVNASRPEVEFEWQRSNRDTRRVRFVKFIKKLFSRT